MPVMDKGTLFTRGVLYFKATFLSLSSVSLLFNTQNLCVQWWVGARRGKAPRRWDRTFLMLRFSFYSVIKRSFIVEDCGGETYKKKTIVEHTLGWLH